MGMTAGSLGLCGPADKPADLCVGPNSDDLCVDPHCSERGLGDGEFCDPYSPPAAVCGNGADGCPPQCCKAKSVEELGQQIVDAVRAEGIAEEATRIVNGARRGAYGTPEDNFGRIATSWTAYLAGKPTGPLPITPQDTALLMILMKIARLIESPKHRDSLCDIVGYALCVENLWADQEATAAKRSQDVD